MVAEPARDDRAFGAVEVAAEICVCLQLSEEGQHLLVGPLVISERGPAIVVLRHSPEEYLPVDRARTAGDTSSRHHHRLRDRTRLTPELPVVVAGHNVRARRIAHSDLFREAVDVRVVRTGFQKQHRAVWVFGQSRCEDGPRRPCADNDEIVLHWKASPGKI